MYTNFLRSHTSTLHHITENLFLGSSPTDEIQNLWNDFIGNTPFGIRKNPRSYHIQVSELRALWHRTYKEAMELYFVKYYDTLGSEVVDVMKSIAAGAPMPKITETHLLRKTATIQMEYLWLKRVLEPNDPITYNEVRFTLEHIEPVINLLKNCFPMSPSHETFIEQYARFVCNIARLPYFVEHRMLWLTNAGAKMLEIAQIFNKPVHWLFYGRIMMLISSFEERRNRRMKAIDRCLKNLKEVSDRHPDVKIFEGLMYYRKAAVMGLYKNNAEEITAAWNTAEECMKTNGKLLNADLLRKSFLAMTPGVTGTPDHVKIENLNISGTMFHNINLHEAAMLAFHDEWWSDIYYHSIAKHVRQATDVFQCNPALYKVLSKYPVRAVAMILSKDPAGRLIQTPATIKSTNR